MIHYFSKRFPVSSKHPGASKTALRGIGRRCFLSGTSSVNAAVVHERACNGVSPPCASPQEKPSLPEKGGCECDGERRVFNNGVKKNVLALRKRRKAATKDTGPRKDTDLELESMTLTDIVDLSLLQKLQDAFAETSKVTTAITNAKGEFITNPGNWSGLCENLMGSDFFAEGCLVRIQDMAAMVNQSRRREIAQCPHVGLTIAALPILVEGKCLACWIFGQLRTKHLSQDEIIQSAERLNCAPEKLAQSLSRLPKLNMDYVHSLLDFAEMLTRVIADIGHKKLELMKKNKEVLGLTEEMRVRDSVLTRFTQASADAMYICDLYTCEILMANEAFCALTKRRMRDLIGQKCWEVFDLVDKGACPQCPRVRLLHMHSEEADPGSRESFNSKYQLWLRHMHQRISWIEGRSAQMIVLQDVTQTHDMMSRLEQLAYYDSATGLANRHKFAQVVRETMQEAHLRLDRCLLCFHLSSLNLFIDVYGDTVTDEIVRVILTWLRENCSDDSRLYRMSMDTFCLVIDSCNDNRGYEVAQAICRRFEQPWLISFNDNELSVVGGASIVLLNYPLFVHTPAQFLDTIRRMFEKARQTDGITVYDEDMDREHTERRILQLQLENSVKQGMMGFSVHYQPIIEMASGTWKGVEALCRWRDKDGIPVSPARFIPEAEKLGLIMPISIWLLESSIRFAKGLGLDLVDGFFLSVNISPRQMMDEDFADKVLRILHRYDFPGDKLNLEITESAEMSFSAFTMTIIEKLRAQNITLALDDFGTGYSSFNNLKNLPVDFMKTERDFIIGIENDVYMQYYLYVMAEIAHANGLKLIAEGIETIEQLRIARRNGADYIQGYFFSTPLAEEELAKQADRFSIADLSFVPVNAEMVNITQWLDGKSAYEVTPNLFKLLNSCVKLMVSDLSIHTIIEAVLELVGKSFGASRCSVFLRETENLFSNCYEWCDEGVSPEKQLLRHVDVQKNTPSLFTAFQKEYMVIASDISKLPDDIYQELSRLDVKAVALMPMWSSGRIIGFAGMDKRTVHEWSPDSMIMLWNLGMILVNLLKREQFRVDAYGKQAMLETLFLNPFINAYVSDPKSYELLWMNENAASRVAESGETIGRKCYEVLEQRSSPCPNCPVQGLLENSAIRHMRKRIKGSFLGRDCLVHDKLIQWNEGYVAHVRYAVDLDAVRAMDAADIVEQYDFPEENSEENNDSRQNI